MCASDCPGVSVFVRYSGRLAPFCSLGASRLLVFSSSRLLVFSSSRLLVFSSFRVPRHPPPADRHRHRPPAHSRGWGVDGHRGTRCRADRRRASVRAADGDRGRAREREDDVGPGNRGPGARGQTMGCLHRRGTHPCPCRLGLAGGVGAAVDRAPPPTDATGCRHCAGRAPPGEGRGPWAVVRRRPPAERGLRVGRARRERGSTARRGRAPHATGPGEQRGLRDPARGGG